MSSNKPGKIIVCGVNSPVYGGNNNIFLDKDIRTWEVICDEVYIITGNFANKYGPKVHIIDIECNRTGRQKISLIGRIINHLGAQVKLAIRLMKISQKVDVVFFNIGEYRNLLPVLTSKILRKKTVIFHRGGDKVREAKLNNPSGLKKIMPLVEAFLLKTSYSLADHILYESPLIIEVGNLQKYRDKLIFWGGYHIDIDRFCMGQMPSERTNIIGHTGRLTKVKGVSNLIKAVPLVLQKNPDTQFVIGGSGDERSKIENEIETLKVKGSVSLKSWIPDEEYPQLLGQLKLFVLPSNEEGIPSVIREAMACGAIVLTTPVGGIPDLIKDGETGFIMSDNSPECIATNIQRILDYPNLDGIAINARKLIESESTFDATILRWKVILEQILPETGQTG